MIRLLEDRTREVEADLQDYYGVALGDLLTGRLTWRRLQVLLQMLPAGSRVARALHPGAWDAAHYLAAQTADNVALVADELAAFRWLWTTSNLKKGAKKPGRPTPYARLPRPGQAAPPQARPAAKPPPSAAIRAAAAAQAA